MKRRFASLGDEPESETEYQSLIVSNYHLEDNDDEPVSFSVLPIQWTDSEVSNSNNAKKRQGKIFLHGSADNGLQKIFMHVIAWKFDLSGLKPEVSLLSKDRRWIKLHKPRKSFQDTVKTVLITLYFLHCVKKKPRLSVQSFWSNLCKDRDLSSYGFKPSQKDLLDHMTLISEATNRDAVLARSKLLLTVLGEKPEDQKPSDKEFEDDDIDNDIIEEADEDSKVEDDLFDSVCAFCDNGGSLIMCDGACMRSFHATKADGRESLCDSLGLTKKEVDDIETFYCKNCEYRQHQCFACGELGSSDKDKGAEVIKCASESCDRFYHPHCIAKLLPPVVKHVPEDLEKKITDGKPFPCPIHFCFVCKGSENKMEPDLQFAVCNRCPKSYHRKCLPIAIAFDGIQTRAWEGLLPNNRILIYCLNHKIIDKLGTPVRDHIKFPDTRAGVREINTSNKRMKPTTKDRVILKNDVGVVKSSGKSTAEVSNVTGKLPSSNIGSKKSSEKIISDSDISSTPESKVMSSKCLTENKSISKNSSEKVISSDISRKLESNKSCLTESKKPISKKLSGSDISRKPKSNEMSRRLSTENKKSISKKFEKPKCAPLSKSSEQIKHDNQVVDADNQTMSIKPIRSVFPPHDADLEKGLVDSFKEARSSILLEGVTEKHKSDDSVDLTTKRDKVIAQEHGNCGDKLMLNHDLLVSTDDQEEQACINESQKSSSHHGNVDQESEKRQEFKMGKSWKTSGKRTLIEQNDSKGLGVSSQLFKEKGVVSQTKRQRIKRAAGHQRRSHSEIEKGTSVKNADENQNREEENHRRESNARPQVGPSSVQDPNSTQNDHLSDHNPSCANKHAQLSTASKSLNKMNTPAADESNLVTTGSLTPDTPIFSRNDTSERIVPPGFAAGPNYAFSLRHSAGWLEE
ncbi:hypothetical protein TSUD_257800 [Trifolium subterraneum]|uniref:Zinc finger PHD-type domain-containing protein n=1 Tax=Trifolium subterraneum TaxID=3900 RepID=A0A2Z6M0C3_TRISU|nr:hypothetical protein TSUD_257800 [Trifolium subterraneum]